MSLDDHRADLILSTVVKIVLTVALIAAVITGIIIYNQ